MSEKHMFPLALTKENYQQLLEKGVLVPARELNATELINQAVREYFEKLRKERDAQEVLK